MRLVAMSHPKLNIFIGILSSLISGAVMPVFGVILGYVIFDLQPPNTNE